MTQKCILIVDDTELVLRALVRCVVVTMLHADVSLLIGVRKARSGADALAILRKHPDAEWLVMTDLRMPGMDGIALLREIRELFPDMRVTTVLHSSLSEWDVKREWGITETPYDRFVCKNGSPTMFIAFGAIVRAFLERS